MLGRTIILTALCLSLVGKVWAAGPLAPPNVPGPAINSLPPGSIPPDPQRYLYPNAQGNAPPLGRPLSGYDHIPYTGYGPLAGYYPLPPNGMPPVGYAQPMPGPYKPGMTRPPVDTYPRQKPLIKPLYTGPIVSHIRTFLDVEQRAPEGWPMPLGPSNFWTEMKFVFGSCRDYNGTAEAAYGEFYRSYVLP